MCRLIRRESETLSLALRLEYVTAIAENRPEAFRPLPAAPRGLDAPTPTQ